MSKYIGYNLGEHFEGFMAQKIKEGRYSNKDEVLRKALALLEKQEILIAEMRAKAHEGLAALESGDYEVYASGDDLLDAVISGNYDD